MQFEKIRKINKSKIIIGGLIGLGVIGAVTILPTYSKYRTTQSFNLVNGKITYKAADMNVIAMYKSEDGKSYTEHTGRMPSNGYIINEKESYCNLNGEKDTNVKLYTNSNGEHIIQKLIKGDKCYLYFDKSKTLADIVVGATSKEGSFSGPSSTTDKGIFSVSDGDGTSYYYRGLVTNNYVSFANKCWRIVRFNGDGSIRIIYDGETCHANGANSESIVASVKYNYAIYYRNAHVGYMYGDTSASASYDAGHTNTTDSTIKAELDKWYDDNLINFASYIDKNAGFCNDRELSNGTGVGTTETYYAAYGRLNQTSLQTPTLECKNKTRNLFTPSSSNKGNKMLSEKPIGLITADEVIFAGGYWAKSSTNFWLYNNQTYWTMSPSRFNANTSYPYVYYLFNNGQIADNLVGGEHDVRPVINLKTGTMFNPNTEGTVSNPYTIIQ